MRRYILIVFLAIASIQISCKENVKSEEAPIASVHVVSTEVFKEVVNDGNVTLIDVRTPKEFAEGSLPGAVNIDYYDQKNFFDAFDKYDRKEPIYIYCRTGNRSIPTAQKLVEMGFEEIYDMDGGYMQWQRDQE